MQLGNAQPCIAGDDAVMGFVAKAMGLSDPFIEAHRRNQRTRSSYGLIVAHRILRRGPPGIQCKKDQYADRKPLKQSGPPGWYLLEIARGCTGTAISATSRILVSASMACQ
jgi:hypothetical protein